MTRNGITQYQVEEQGKQIHDLDEKVDKIMTNHLPHLKEQITKLQGTFEKKTSNIQTRVNVTSALNIGAIIIGAIILKYL